MNKKLLVLLPAAMLMLASCGGGNTDPSKTDPSKTDPSTTSTTSETTSTTSETTSEEDLSKYGSLEAPLTVAQANAIMKEECTEDKKTTLHPMFVKGFVTDAATPSKYGWGNFHLGDTLDDENGVLVYTINKSDTVTKLAQNDELVLKGYGKLWGETLEIADGLEGETKVYPEALVRKAGTSKINAASVDHVTFNDLPATAVNDTTVEFTVTVEENYKLDKVTVNGSTVEAAEGKYSFEVAGDMEISAVAVDAAKEYVSVAKYSIVALDSTKTGGTYVNSNEEALKLLHKESGSDLVTAVSAYDTIAYCPNGGSKDSGTDWYLLNAMKIGKSKGNGSITYTLGSKVTRIAITGYTWNADVKLTVGGTEFACTEMALANKTNCADLTTATVATIDFDETDSLTIAAIKPGFVVVGLEFFTLE